MVDAFLTVPGGTVALMVYEWSGRYQQDVVLSWREITRPDDLTRAAAPDMPLSDAIAQASVSRLRPVLLAAATTILGMIPLLSDAFFASMAVTIMGGLAFASVLTLIAAPVFYMMFFNRVAARQQAEAVPA